MNSEAKLPCSWPVTCHTAYVGNGSTFVAIKGYTQDGVAFIPEALKKGARTIVVAHDAIVSDEMQMAIVQHNATLQVVDDARKALATLSAQAHGYPADKLQIIGITGTKGKTTTAFLVHHLLNQAGIKAALISTVHNQIGETIYKKVLTTPQPDYLHMFFALCIEQGVTHVVMEVAAQALSLHRVHGVAFAVGAFTNIAHEHMEFYASMQEYFQAKARLLEHMKADATVVCNGDDAWLGELVLPESIRHISIQMHQIAVASVDPIAFSYQGHMFKVPALIGRFNIYNACMSSAIAQACGISVASIEQAFLTFTGVKGRLQKHVMPNGAMCYIDYAHTPDSYAQVLQLLSAMTDHLIVVFGCSGGKDMFKRPKMGAIAVTYAQHIILTADNPAHEDPMAICHDIMAGIAMHEKKRVVCELDRAQAIALAYAMSKKGSIIAILGKGPDEWQIEGDKRYFFSDTATVQQLEGTP